jgi:hypothetical protein
MKVQFLNATLVLIPDQCFNYKRKFSFLIWVLFLAIGLYIVILAEKATISGAQDGTSAYTVYVL